MFFSSLRKRFARIGLSLNLTPRAPSKPPSAFRPLLEALEGRLAPAIVTWIGPSGDWDTPSRWSTGSLPTPADDVQINSPNITVSHIQGTFDAVHSLTSKASLNISSGTLSVAAASTLSGGLTLSAGTLTGAGNMTVKGKINWTGGTMSGIGTTTIAVGATLNLNGGSSETLDTRNLTNLGQIIWSDPNDFFLGNGAILTNGVGATFSVQNDRSLTITGSGNAEFINAGTFTKTSSTGTTTLNGVPFINNGSLKVQSGTLSLQSSLQNTKTVTVAPAGTLEVGGTSRLGGTISSAGAITFDYGTFDIVGGFNVTGTTTIQSNTIVAFDATSSIHILNQSGGTLTGPGNVTITGAGGRLNWTGGTMSGTGTTTVAAGDALNLNGTSQEVLITRTLTNFGHAVWSGANDLYLQTGALFDNGLNATFTVQNDRTLFDNGGAAAFINSGTLTKTASTGTTTFGISLNNSGTVNVQTGTLSLTGGANRLGGSVLGAGTLDIESSSTDVLGGLNVTGTVVIGNFAEVVFNGNARVHILNQAGGTITGPGNVTITGAGAQLNWSSGTMTGNGTTTIAAGAALNLNGTTQETIDARTLINLGTTTWSGTNDLYLQDGAVFDNGPNATFLVQNDQTLFSNGGPTTFINSGTWTKTAGTGTTTVEVPLNNSGTVNVQSGTLSLTGGGRSPGVFTAVSGATFNVDGGVIVLGKVGGAGDVTFTAGSSTVTLAYDPAGTTTISNTASIQFLGGGTSGPINNSGQVVLGAGPSFTVNGNFTVMNGGTTQLDGGTLALSGAGSLLDIQSGGEFDGLGTITGAVSNAGTLNVGGQGLIGSLAVSGNFTQLAAGTVNSEIGGKSTTNQFDQLTIGGTALFDGTLNVTFINGFNPTPGSASWKILKYASHTGVFATANVPGGFTVQYNASDGTIA